MIKPQFIVLTLASIFALGCIEEPPEKVEINLIFPDGTIEENGTYILGDFKENFSFKVEPRDAAVYLDDMQLRVTNSEFVVSVDKGGDYELRISTGGVEKAYNIFIGHGEIMATEVSKGPGEGYVKIYFEDETPVKNRSIRIVTEDSNSFRNYELGDHIERSGGWIVATDDEGLTPWDCGQRPASERATLYIDVETKKLLFKCINYPDWNV